MASRSPDSERLGGLDRFARDELIGQLYASSRHGIAALVADLLPAERANLALFCYQRAHLREIGLAIAATCDQWSLVNAAGRAGDALYASSRARPALERTLPLGRRKITLAQLSPSTVPALDDFEDAAEEAGVAEQVAEFETV